MIYHIPSTCNVRVVGGDELVLVADEFHLVLDPHVVPQVVAVPEDLGTAELAHGTDYTHGAPWSWKSPGTCGTCRWSDCPCELGSTPGPSGCEPWGE